MSLRTRFILIFGIGGIFFLLILASLVFYRMEAAMINQLEIQFQSDARSRINNLNHKFLELTERFQSIAKLPMFRSMRFHQLTLNQAAFKNDVRQMELYVMDLMHQYTEMSQVVYIGNKGSEIFRIDNSGIKSNLSDRSEDKVIKKILDIKNNNFRVEKDIVEGEIKNIVWWVPVYVSADHLDGVIGFSIKYDYIRKQVRWLAVNSKEIVCLSSVQDGVLLNTNNENKCDQIGKDLWQASEKVDLPGLSWVVALSVNSEIFLDDVKDIRLTVFGFIFPVIAIFGFIFSFIFSNKIIRAIDQLVAAARIMGRNKKLSPIDLNRNDELGDLANEMNRSAKLIEDNLIDLEERNRDTVEKNRKNMQAIMDHSPAIIYLKDINNCYTFVNKRFQDIFNVKGKDVIGKNDYDLFSKSLADLFLHNTKDVIKAGHALEVEEDIPQEELLHTYLSIRFPLFTEDNDIYAICGISTDITDIKLQKEQIRRSQKMDALGKLTGGIAHDYNNMLGIILGYSDLLINKLHGQPDLAKFANEIQRAGERGVQLTNKLLGFSRKKSSGAEVLNINNILRDDKHMLQKTLTSRITLTLDLEDDIWDVFLNNSDLEDAILNLSINAMHSMESGGHLTFQTQNKYIDESSARLLDVKSGKYAVLNVIDTGCGIDDTVLDRIFDPFFSTKGDKGTGLGLSQVYGFVERNGGNIKVYSELGKGSRFSLYFPRYLSNKKEITNELKNKPKPDELTGNETILIVDDEPALVELAYEILSQNGYSVLCAQSAKQALEILENKEIDLILSDVIMSEIDGYQLAAIVQKKYPAIKIQLVSGFSDDRHASMVNDSLQKNLISKPYNAQDLLQRMRELLGSLKD